MEEEEYTVPAIEDMEDIDLIYTLLSRITMITGRLLADLEYDHDAESYLKSEMESVAKILWKKAKYL